MKFIFFGLGKLFDQIIEKYLNEDIVALSDNNLELHGSYRYGIKIISPDKIPEYEFDYVIITSYRWIEICEQLRKIGVNGNKLYNPTEFPMLKPVHRKALFKSPIRYSDAGDVLYFAYELSENGGSLAMKGLLEAFKNLEYQTDVICNTDGPVKEYLLEKGINVLYCPEAWYDKETLHSIILEYKIIVVNSLQQYRLVEMLNDVKREVIWWIHEPPYFYENYVFCPSISNCNFMNVKTFSVSNLCKNVFYKYIHNNTLRMDTLPAGIEDMDNEIVADKTTDNTVCFAVVGHICEEKGQAILLEAYEKLEKEYKERIKIRFIGNIPDNHNGRDFRNRAAKYDNVILHGHISTGQVHNMYNDDMIDVLVCPSRIETLSLATVESMMHRRCVVVSSNTGIAEYIDDGVNGYVFDDGNSNDLARIMAYIVANKSIAERIGNMGRKLYDDMFSVAALSKRIEKIIGEK